MASPILDALVQAVNISRVKLFNLVGFFTVFHAMSRAREVIDLE